VLPTSVIAERFIILSLSYLVHDIPVSIKDLPPETLLHVIDKGCEDEGFIQIGIDFPLPNGGDHSYSCRRKAFASTVRTVCQQWRNMVDLPVNHHYWIARLCIDSPMNTDRLAWIRSLVNFREQLQTLRCDVFVSITWKHNEDWKPYKATHPQEAYTLMKLYTHFLEILSLHSSRVVSVYADIGDLQIFRHFVQLLPRIQGERLTELLIFHNPEGRPGQGGSLQGLWSSSAPSSSMYSPVLLPHEE
jgi:hypothetical protein